MKTRTKPELIAAANKIKETYIEHYKKQAIEPLLTPEEEEALEATLQFTLNNLDNRSLIRENIRLIDKYLQSLEQMLNAYRAYQTKPSKKTKRNFELAQEQSLAFNDRLTQVSITPFKIRPRGKIDKRKEAKSSSIIEMPENFPLDELGQHLTRLETNTAGLNNTQQLHLAHLCDALRSKLKNNPSNNTLAEINECVIETNDIITAYRRTQLSISAIANPKTFMYGDRSDELNAASYDFIKDIKNYEKKCAKWNLGQKIFIGACTVVGGLLGAVLGAAVGLAAGAAIGGGVGSVVPLFGNIAGAVAGGNVGAIVGIIKGVGIGAAIGTAAAAAIMGSGVAFGAKKGSSSSLFMTKQQKFVTNLKGSMETEVKLDAKDAKKEIELRKKLTDLETKSDALNLGKGWLMGEEKQNKSKALRIQTEIQKIHDQLKDLAAKKQNRKSPKP